MSKRRELKKIGYKNKSRIFLMSMFDISYYSINASTEYLIDVNFIQGGFPKIVLIFDNIDYEPLKTDIYKISCLPEYIDCEYADNEKEICIYLDIPKQFKQDFILFLTGKYSQFSEDLKKRLLKIYGTGVGIGISEKTGLPNVSVFDVLYPTKEKIRLMSETLGVEDNSIIELLDPPNIQFEEFKKIEELEYE